VQRPLATVVIFGILYGTLVSVLLLPGILLMLLRGYRVASRREDEASSPSGAALSPAGA
jgi:cobalt-zinc-cadmium resistance protein CzcA